MSDPANNRKVGTGIVFLSGLAVGVVIYLVAEWFTPKNVPSPGDHDILLADRLGFIYMPLVLGWLQRSWRRAIAGAVVEVGIGFVYLWLYASRNFFAIMVGFPCLLGGAMASFAGSNRSHSLKGLGLRLGKGLLAGLVLGFTYMVIRRRDPRFARRRNCHGVPGSCWGCSADAALAPALFRSIKHRRPSPCRSHRVCRV